MFKASYDGKEIIDSRGRKLVLRKPRYSEKCELPKMIDEKHADNSRYINMISPALYIAMIDGQVVDKPRTENEILAVLDRLEEEGVYAIMQEVYGSEGSIDEVKKS